MLNPDYRDMLSALSEEKAEFLVVGAFALAAHGLPRATGDLDVWVRPGPENEEKVLRALRRFGAPMDQLRSGDLCRPGTIFQIGVEPRRIDLLTSITAVDFNEAWHRRRTVSIEGMVVPVLGRDDLIANKRAVGRPQDLADVKRLESGTP